MNSSMSHEEIQRKMAAIRGNLDGEVGGLVQNARRLADWRHYVRAFPWTSVAAAAAAGFVVAPRSNAPAPAPVVPERFVPRVAKPETSPPVEAAVTGGIFGSLASLATNWALRMAMQYAAQQLKNHWSAPRGGNPYRTVEP